MGILKTTFTSERATVSESIAAPAAEAVRRTGPRASWFVAVSLVAHAALFFAMRAEHHVPDVRAVSEGYVEFSVPPLTAPVPEMPAAMIEPEPPVPEPLVHLRAPRLAARLAAASADPQPSTAPTAAAEPATDATRAAAGALPSDGGGDLALATGAGGDGGPLGRGGRGDGTGTAHGPGAGGPSGDGVDRRALALSWKAAVERLVHERASRNYPRSALRARLGGTVLLSITVDARGHITMVRVDRTSGVEALDEAAVASVHDLADLPAPPAELAWQTRALRMPVGYAVR